MTKTDNAARYVGAYLVEGSSETLDALVDLLSKEGVVERGSPDLFLRAYRSFGVDDARDIRDRAQRKAVTRDGRIFALFAPGITVEAQNALLKVVEEPPAGALFFLVVPSPQTLLPTLRSRMQTMRIGTKGGNTDAESFLAATPPKRLEMLKVIYEHDDDEGRDMAKVLAFLEGLEACFAKEKPTPSRQEGLLAIYRARKYASDKGSLLKPLLEQIALLTPRI
jgi:DNA polymerase III delta prime subunit